MKQSSIKALVLDVGGVILRTEDNAGRDKLAKKYNLLQKELYDLVFHSDQAIASTIGQCSQDEVWQNVADTLTLSPQALNEFKGLFFEGDKIDQKLINFLRETRSLVKTALLSNAWSDARRDFAEIFGVVEGQTVDCILISSELGAAKPDKKIYRILANQVDCEYDEILFVDDSIENTNAAEKVGIQTIHFQPGMYLINEIKSRLGIK